MVPLLPLDLISGEFIALLLAASLIGFGNGLSSGGMMTLGADLAPRDGLSAFLGLWRLIGDGGRLSGPVCVGYIADLLGCRPRLWLSPASASPQRASFSFLYPKR